MYRFTLQSAELGVQQISEPVNARRLSLTLQRHRQYHGILTEVSEKKLTFIADAANYIRKVRSLAGADAQVSLVIEQSYTSGRSWQLLYMGRLDFTSYDDQPAKNYISIGIEQTGPVQLLLNREKTEVNLFELKGIEGAALPPYFRAPYTVAMHSKSILQRLDVRRDEIEASYPIEANYADSVGSGTGTATRGTLIRHHWAYSDQQLLEAKDFTDSLNEGFAFDVNDAPPAIPTVFVASLGGTVTIEAQIHSIVSVTAGPATITGTRKTWRLVLDVQGYGREVLYSHYDETYGAGTYEATFSFTRSYTLGVNAEVRLYLETLMDIDIPRSLSSDTNYTVSSSAQVLEGSFFKVTNVNTTAASSCRGIALHEAFARMADHLTNGAVTSGELGFRSEWLGRTDSQPVAYPTPGRGAFRVLTNGYNIRSFPARSVFATLASLFAAVDAVDCLGMGATFDTTTGRYTLRIEDRSWFYDRSSTVMQLEDVKDPRIVAAPDLLYSEVEVGADTWASEDYSGLDEPNSKRQYTTQSKVAKGKYAAVTDYLISPYAIELTRREQYVDTATKDFQYDEKNFLICVGRSPAAMYAAERDEYLQAASGLLDPTTLYNAALNPSRVAKRHLPFVSRDLKSTKIEANQTWQLAWLPGYGPFEGNSLMVDNSTTGVDALRYADVPEAERTLRPELYRLEVALSRTQIAALRSNPYGVVRWSIDRKTYYSGFVQSAKIELLTGRASLDLIAAY